MALADRAAVHQSKARGEPCSIAVLYAELPPADADTLGDLIASSVFSTDIAKMVTDEYPDREALRAAPVQRHRRRECRCNTL